METVVRLGVPLLDEYLEFAVAFSPDGKLLASVDGDGTVRLWNSATHRSIGVPIYPVGGIGGVGGVAFSPDGLQLASGDSTVQFWQLRIFENPYSTLCSDAGRLSQQSWAHYAPSEPQPKLGTSANRG